ncbi:MAG: dethiobiotin synthase [Verrucomicrobiota bacterium]
MGKAVFITGTDTDVGKTWVTVRLLGILRSRGINAVGFKPIECGSHEDSQALLGASADAGVTLEEVNPVHLDEPVAPAAVTVPIDIRFASLKESLDRLREKSEIVLVEGAGGWLVPVNEAQTVADLAVHLDLPVVVVAANRLGCLNHSLLTARAVLSTELECLGVYLNRFGEEDLSQQTNAKLLTKWLEEIPLIDQDLESLADLIVAS